MPVRYHGYCCINLTLGRTGSTGATISAAAAGRLPTVRRLRRIGEIALHNVRGLRECVFWNAANDIHLYRMTSGLFPLATHPTLGYRLDQLPTWLEIQGWLENIGNIARNSHQRLSTHPGQFVCLGSPRENVVLASIRELDHHAEWMSVMNLTIRPNMNIHMGGVYNDKRSTALAFIKNFRGLTAQAQSYLTVENDDKPNGWSVRDLIEQVWPATLTPIVFDIHHHRFCSGGDTDAQGLASVTWTGWGDEIPELHYSESRTAENSQLRHFGETCTPLTHSDWIVGPIPEYPGRYDVTIEAKRKDLALLRYLGREWSWHGKDE